VLLFRVLFQINSCISTHKHTRHFVVGEWRSNVWVYNVSLWIRRKKIPTDVKPDLIFGLDLTHILLWCTWQSMDELDRRLMISWYCLSYDDNNMQMTFICFTVFVSVGKVDECFKNVFSTDSIPNDNLILGNLLYFVLR